MIDTLFNSQAFQTLTEAERALKAWGIKYEKKPDGTLVVPGNMDISGEGLANRPDLMSISGNQLTSLAPGIVATVKNIAQRKNNVGTSNRSTRMRVYPDGNIGAPSQAIKESESNLGKVPSWEGAPLEQLLPDAIRAAFRRRADQYTETKARQIEQNIQNATVLQAPIRASKPLRLKRFS